MAETESRLRHLPVSFFAMVMGLAGFTLVLQRATRLWQLPNVIGLVALGITVLAFVVLALLYARKILRYGVDVVTEFRHPVKLAFFPTVSISLILLSTMFLEVNLNVASFLWFVGVPIQLALTLMVLNAWIHRTTFEVQHMSPAWFIPVVGNILVPIPGVALAAYQVSWFFFAVGLLFWIVLLTIIFNRIIFHQPLTERLAPTLFILIAPPAVGFLAHTRLVGHLDTLAYVLYYSALFLGLVLVTQFRMFARLSFYLSWWAYSFPIAALTLATMQMYQYTGLIGFKWIAAILALALTALIGLLLTLTARAARRGEICVPD
jgi:tellurite resistance protein